MTLQILVRMGTSVDGGAKEVPHFVGPCYSVVIPFFNEAENVLPLLTKTFAFIETLSGGVEILLIDDGSADGTVLELEEASLGRSDCRIIRFPRNQGQATALLTGLRQARGEFIFTMDGDGQNDPADLARMLPMLAGGEFDLVCGIRTPRDDSGLRRLMSFVANFVRSRLLRDGLRDAGCQLRVFRREIIAALQPSPLLQAFLPAMAANAGFRITQIPVSHHPRRFGSSKYGLFNLSWRPALEMFRLRREFGRKKK